MIIAEPYFTRPLPIQIDQVRPVPRAWLRMKNLDLNPALKQKEKKEKRPFVPC